MLQCFGWINYPSFPYCTFILFTEWFLYYSTKQFSLLHARFRDGVLVKCEIYGEVQVNCLLSGLPDLTLSFANPSILHDVRFHSCVRFRPWESQQILSFVPPDGQFKLMSYRCVVLMRNSFLNFLLWMGMYEILTGVLTLLMQSCIMKLKKTVW